MSVLIPAQRISRWSTCPPWRSPFTTEELLHHFGKGLEIPKGGWTRATFADDGKRLILAMHRTARLAQKKAIPFVAGHVEKMLNNHVSRVISKVRARRGAKADAILLNVDEAIWLQAIDEVFREAGAEVVLEVVPALQSVMSQGYSKTSVMLGQRPEVDTNARIASQAREVAAKITRINDTTRRQVEDTVRRSVADGMTVSETAEKLRERMEGLNHNRSMTIARTELNNVWTQGAASAFEESSTLTHLTVIGCEAREAHSPHYKGQSTCNYPNLPRAELNAFLAVGFHINHTGSLVASGFRDP